MKAETGLLSVFLALAPVAGNADDHQHDAPIAQKTSAHEFQFSVGEGAQKRFIPVDCQLLGNNGALSAAFVKQIDIYGHLDSIEQRMGANATEAQKIFTFKQHLRAHQIMPEKVDKAAQHCRDNYL